MKNLRVKNFLRIPCDFRRKNLLGVFGLMTVLNLNSLAQNSSYNADAIPLPGSGWPNVGFANGVLGLNTTGINNSAFGYYSLAYNRQGSDNTAVGHLALFQNDRSGQNVGIGSEALYSNFSGGENTATGYRALYNSIDASYNVANGAQSLFNTQTGRYNTAAGAYSLYYNKVGENNVANGYEALFNNTGNNNVASGYQALYNNNAAANNVASGYQALYNNISGSENVAYGTQALYTDPSGNLNVAIGHQALFSSNATHHTTAVGDKALYNTTSGYDNTAVGERAFFFNVTSHFNVAIGANSGNTGSFAGGHSNTMLGSWTGFTAAGFGNSTAVGTNAIINASNRVWLGGAGATVWTVNSYNISDRRFKNNIKEEEVKGLEFINLLRPVTYDLDCKKFTEHLAQNMPDSARKRLMEQDFTAVEGIRQSGFIAQEVEAAAKKAGYNFSGVYSPDKNNSTDTYGISYYQFVVPLVKAVQEMDKQKAEQDQKIEKLLQQLETQQKVIAELQQKSGATTGIDQNTSSITGFSMNQNEPNPFTHETIIKYSLPQSVSSAYMAVYDLSGKQITTFAIDQKGASQITLTSEKLAAGIYIYSIVADGKVMDSKRMIVADK